MASVGHALTARLAFAVMLFSDAAQAIEIHSFDKMAIPDQGEYVGLLIGGAEKVLREEGKPELAEKVERLFTTVVPGDAHAVGSVEFQRNLARARVADVDRLAKDRNALRIEVEDAMAVTLKKNGIELPASFYTVMKDFKPKHPLRAMEVRQFDKMAVEDQAAYIQVLVDVAQKVLIDDGKNDLAVKVRRLFAETRPGEKKPPAMADFERNLAEGRVGDAEEAAKHPNASRLEVETVLDFTLQKNGIELPHSFFTADKNFRPQHPPKEK